MTDRANHWRTDEMVKEARAAVIEGIKRHEESGGAAVETMELYGTINGQGDNLLDALCAAVAACAAPAATGGGYGTAGLAGGEGA